MRRSRRVGFVTCARRTRPVELVVGAFDAGVVEFAPSLGPPPDGCLETRPGREHAGHLARLDEFNLLLIEQPLGEEDWWGHRIIAEACETPICLDESILSVESAESAIEFGAASNINIKPGRVAGFLQSKEIHDLCLSRGIPVWCGGMLETGIGRSANVALAALPGFTLPGDTSASNRYYAEDVTEPFVLHDGLLTVPTGPGIGIDPLPENLKSMSVNVVELTAG